jgi:NhaP-type Na+/H+ or K+/H+ antiporter
VGAGAVKAALALAAGLVLLVLVFANLDHLGEWADRYGTIWVYLGYFLVLSIAGRLFWSGADTLVAAIIPARNHPDAPGNTARDRSGQDSGDGPVPVPARVVVPAGPGDRR